MVGALGTLKKNNSMRQVNEELRVQGMTEN